MIEALLSNKKPSSSCFSSSLICFPSISFAHNVIAPNIHEMLGKPDTTIDTTTDITTATTIDDRWSTYLQRKIYQISHATLSAAMGMQMASSPS